MGDSEAHEELEKTPSGRRRIVDLLTRKITQDNESEFLKISHEIRRERINIGFMTGIVAVIVFLFLGMLIYSLQVRITEMRFEQNRAWYEQEKLNKAQAEKMEVMEKELILKIEGLQKGVAGLQNQVYGGASPGYKVK